MNPAIRSSITPCNLRRSITDVHTSVHVPAKANRERRPHKSIGGWTSAGSDTCPLDFFESLKRSRAEWQFLHVRSLVLDYNCSVRTPLSWILTYLDMMQNTGFTPGDEDAFYVEHKTLIDEWVTRLRVVLLFETDTPLGYFFFIATMRTTQTIKVHEWHLDTAPSGWQFTEVQMWFNTDASESYPDYMNFLFFVCGDEKGTHTPRQPPHQRNHKQERQ